MKRSFLQLVSMTLGICLAGVVGCAPSGPPPTASASGQVTSKGQPVKSAHIYFVAAEKGYSADQALNAEGKYFITTGLPPARYKVFVTPPRMTKPPMPGQPPEQTAALDVPTKYLSETSTDLTADIKAGENKDVNFKLD